MKMKKENKIMVVVDQDLDARRKVIAKMAVEFGFARTTSDAGKIIQSTPYDYDLNSAYFVMADTYDFRKSVITTQRLYEMAAKGLAVIVGVKRLPAEYEFICQVFYKHDF